jgi:hypothetical protein
MQLQLGGRMKYSLGGVELHGYKPFEDIISPLNDHMATYSLNTAKDEDAISWPLILGGLAVETVGIVDGVTRYCNWRNTGVNQDYTFTWITVLGGGAIDFIGVIVQGQAQVDKFNAVKRYNAVARGEDKVSLFYSPEHKQLELGWSGRF